MVNTFFTIACIIFFPRRFFFEISIDDHDLQLFHVFMSVRCKTNVKFTKLRDKNFQTLKIKRNFLMNQFNDIFFPYLSASTKIIMIT